MAWYSTGTVSVTNGSATITGSGTTWFGALQDGWGFIGPDGRTYEVDTVDSNTQITLASNYQGSTAASQAYTISPNMSLADDLASSVKTLIGDFQSVKDNAGSGKFGDGTVTAPGVAFISDPDTGLRRPGSNAVALVAGGADKLSVTGNVASGDAVQSSATDTTEGRLLKVSAFGLGLNNGTLSLAPSDNLDTLTVLGFWRYDASTTGAPTSAGVVQHLVRLAGAHTQVATSHVGDMYVRSYVSGVWSSWVELVKLDSAGDLNIDSGTLFVDASTNRVGVGTVTPTSSLSIGDGTSFVVAEIHADATPTLVLNNEATASGFSRITFETAGAYVGRIAYSNQFNYMGFETNGAERMRIDSAGNVGIGTTIPGARLNAETATGVCFDALNSSETAGSAMMRSLCNRPANAAYAFFHGFSDANGTADLEFSLAGDGNGYCDGAWAGGGADYAEYFEWLDGNPMAEDRRGIPVVLVGDKIREAMAGEEPIGVISGNPSVVGDAAAFRWKGKYLRDDFGSAVMEDYEAVSWIETVTETETVTEQATITQEYTKKVIEIINGAAVQITVTKTRDVPLFDEYPLTDATGLDLGIHREPRMIEVPREVTKEVEHSYAADGVPTGITVPADAARVTQARRKLNPDYVEGTDYTPREDRPEWDTVGLMGKLRLRTGQVTGAGWVKMRDISADVEEWLVK